MIIDDDAVTLTQEEQVDTITEEYVLLPAGQQPTSTTVWSEIQPDYVDNVSGTQYEYWTRQKLTGHDDQANEGFTRYTEPVNNKGLTNSGKTAAMVRQYGDGVLVCRKGKTVGALVNADGSFDVVQISWSGDIPTAGAVLASYGSKLMVMRDDEGVDYLKMEDLRGSTGLTITETIKCESDDFLTPTYKPYSITSVSSSSGTDMTAGTTIIEDDFGNSNFTEGKLYSVVYVSKDKSLKCYTLGSRVGNRKGASSLAVGINAGASGDFSYTFGNTVYARSMNHAFLAGKNLKAGREHQVIFGQNNVLSTDELFIIANDVRADDNSPIYSGNIIGINDKGRIRFRNLPTEHYGSLYTTEDSNLGMCLVLGLYADGGSIINRIRLVENNFLIGSNKYFYEPNDTISLTSNYASFSGHVNSSKSTIRFSIPVPKDLTYCSTFSVTRLKGSLFGNSGYIQYASGTTTNYNTDWLAQCDVEVTKTHERMLTVILTLTGGGNFANVTGATPICFTPSTGSSGGIVISIDG